MKPYAKIAIVIVVTVAVTLILVLYYQKTELAGNVPAQPRLPQTYYCSTPGLIVPRLPADQLPSDPFAPRYSHCCMVGTGERILESRTTWGENGETGVDLYDLQGILLDHYDIGGVFESRPSGQLVQTESCELIHPDYYFQFVKDPDTQQYLKDKGFYQ